MTTLPSLSRETLELEVLNGDLNISCFLAHHPSPCAVQAAGRTFKAIADLSEKLPKLRVMPAILLYIG